MFFWGAASRNLTQNIVPTFCHFLSTIVCHGGSNATNIKASDKGDAG